jgi:hypothetical protein
MRLYTGLALTCSCLLACASGPHTAGNPEAYGWRDDGRVWVRGPWEQIRPAKDVDEVIDQLCPAVMQLPRAQRGEYGQEVYERKGRDWKLVAIVKPENKTTGITSAPEET